MSVARITWNGAVAEVALETGHDGNRLDDGQIAELTMNLRALRDQAPGAVLLTAKGDLSRGRLGYTAEPSRQQATAMIGQTVDLLEAFEALDAPKVTFFAGAAEGLGAALALRSDLVLLGPSAELGFPEARRGFAPFLALDTLLRRVAAPTAVALVATTKAISAERAVQLGLADEIADAQRARVLAAELAERRAVLIAARAFARQRGPAPMDRNALVERMTNEYLRATRSGRQPAPEASLPAQPAPEE